MVLAEAVSPELIAFTLLKNFTAGCIPIIRGLSSRRTELHIQVRFMIEVWIHSTDHGEAVLARKPQPFIVERADQLGAFLGDASLAEARIAPNASADLFWV
jgi:hypothetical protein